VAVPTAFAILCIVFDRESTAARHWVPPELQLNFRTHRFPTAVSQHLPNISMPEVEL
jgi:hypothetical protein